MSIDATSDTLFDKWNRNKENNNCYAFAFDRLQPGADEKLQPGEVAGLPDIPEEDKYQCGDLKARIIKDNPGTVQLGPGERVAGMGYRVAGKGHRVALFVDNHGENRDYHFYREMPDGTWWHKPGSLPVSKVDDAGNVIRDPLEADRDYVNDGAEDSNYNYATFCGFFWVPEARRSPRPQDDGSRAIALMSALVVAVILVALTILLFF
jgi:hypothetical protein